MPATILPESALSSAYRAAKGDAPGQALLAYAGAFCARDATAIAGLFDEYGLVEIPLLKPNRLVGRREILRGHAAAFETVVAADIAIAQPAVQGDIAIAAGTLNLQRATGEEDQHPLGIVAETGKGGLRRLSLYFDGRQVRRWADRAIF